MAEQGRGEMLVDGWMDEGRVTISENGGAGNVEKEREREGRGNEVSYLLVVMTVRMDTSLTGFCLLLSSLSWCAWYNVSEGNNCWGILGKLRNWR